MKKQHSAFLMGGACVLLAFVLGLSLGRMQRHPITVTCTSQVLPEPDREITLLVNINTADLAQLSALPGIGEAYAQRILDYRHSHGPFAAPEDLLLVEGIGPGRLEAIIDYITVGGNT